MATLWYNGLIYTMTEKDETVEAIITDNGWIKAAGKLKDLKEHDQIDRLEDLDGGVLFPGFTDSHLHMIGLGETMLRLDLSEVTSSAEMKRLLEERTRQTKSGEWLIGDGWNENNFPDRKIFHRTELDEIAPESPLLLTRICRHAALANTNALERAGISDDTPDPPGGVIVRDRNGRATGYLLDRAADLVRDVQPPVQDSELQLALSTAVERMLEKGLTGGHTEDLNYYGGFQRTFRTFQEVIGPERKKFRVNLLVHHEVVDDMHRLGYTYGKVDDYVSFGAMKIFADGALGGRTALLSHPYNDAPETSGVAIHSKAELVSLVKKARERQMPVAVHVIGDLALEYAIAAVEAHPPPPHTRDRFIHVQIARPDLLERLRRLNVILDLQPGFVLSDFPWVEERLGNERLAYSFAWKTLLDNDVICAGSSDAPIEPVDPLIGIYAAITRRESGADHGGYIPEQKLSAFEAVSLYTTGSAKAVSSENESGQIRRGFRADFTLLDRDILQTEPEQILEAKVLGTIIDGEYQYHNGSKGE
ncbi:amidohydrolase [Alteribacillus sp. HJP-4]|uniref:amidohydrolase n=1 Tax=Alteribacillus sp. HJP-4 TaxID=2775394 RepID=UPI0035CD2FE1